MPVRVARGRRSWPLVQRVRINDGRSRDTAASGRRKEIIEVLALKYGSAWQTRLFRPQEASTISDIKPRHIGAIGLGSSLLGICLLAMILALIAQGRKIAALEGQIAQSRKMRVQEANMINQLNMYINKRFGKIEERIGAVEGPKPSPAAKTPGD